MDPNRPSILTLRSWLTKLQPRRHVERVAILHLIQREEGEPDWLVAVLVLDDEDIDEADPEYLDLGQLRLSLEGAGRFFPWTCSCGEPGCAGRLRGVAVAHGDGRTTWLDLDGRRHLEFSTARLREAYDAAILEGRDLLAAKPELDVTPDQNGGEYRAGGGSYRPERGAASPARPAD